MLILPNCSKLFICVILYPILFIYFNTTFKFVIVDTESILNSNTSPILRDVEVQDDTDKMHKVPTWQSWFITTPIIDVPFLLTSTTTEPLIVDVKSPISYCWYIWYNY